ncbi:MAG: cation transporter [Bacteroidales bacterium]|nr:cation transporter [Bacteroidales bacterium]MBN2821424.1 cation transporter [Bacteroidales bacterium]
MSTEDRVKAIKTASWIGIGGNAILALLKLFTGFFADSLAVLADGIDSSSDVLTSVITLYIASLLAKPPSIKFPYGYAKAETNATSALSFIIFVAGIQLGITALKKLISGDIPEMPDKFAIVIMFISISGKLFLAWQQNFVGRKVKSSMLIANAKNMQNDVLISSAVLVGLICTYVFKLPILDAIAALLVSMWIVWVAVKIFLETNLELMDGNVDKVVYEKVFRITESVTGVSNPHRMRIRKIGPKKMISVDIEVDGNKTISEGHRIAHDVEDTLKRELDDVFDVVIHIEPYGDHIEEKGIGISRQELDK